MSAEAPLWAARHWWDAAGDHFASTDHDVTAAYAYTASRTFGPFSLVHPPDESEIRRNDLPWMNGQTLAGFVKLGASSAGQVVREWPDEREVRWWSQPADRPSRWYRLFVHDSVGQPQTWERHWFPLEGALAVEAVRHDAVRLSRLTGGAVLWGRALGVIDMH